MKQLPSLMVIISVLFCCNNAKKEPINNNDIQRTDSADTKRLKPHSEPMIHNESDTAKKPQVSEKFYVTAENGLTVRQKPSLNSAKIATLDFGTEVSIVEHTGMWLEIIDEGNKINGQWVKVETEDQTTGYVFNGFLTKEIRSNLFTVLRNAEWKGMELQLVLSNITEEDYNSFRAAYDMKVIEDISVKQDSSYFIFNTSGSLYKLNREKRGLYFDYYGHVEPLNSEIFGGGGSGIYEMFLVEKNQDLVTRLFAFTDFNGNVPVISPDNSRFISYQSSALSFVSHIALYRIGDNFIPKDYVTYETTEWLISEIVWVDNTSFALKVYDKYEGRDKDGKKRFKNLRYVKASID